MQRKFQDVRWQQHLAAEQFLISAFHKAMQQLPVLKNLEARLLKTTSTRLFDWVDHLVFYDSPDIRRQMDHLGFESLRVAVEEGHTAFGHSGAIFPGILLRTARGSAAGELTGMAIQVENIAVLLNALSLQAEIEGSPLAPFRRACLWQENGFKIWAVERRAYPGFIPQPMPKKFAHQYLNWYQGWLNRPRNFDDDEKGMAVTLQLARQLVDEWGKDLGAWIAFEAERLNWLLKNRAGQIQKRRQDLLGLGWANHDHHTFRSSRRVFSQLLQILQLFGFELREKFYAGAEAGWGAQVLEQPVCRLVVFADVDLSPQELEMDFTQSALTQRSEKGTVGLWCALHGESMLTAGLHHLAARFAFADLPGDLEKENINMLPAFSNFPYLKQAFSQGERWEVKEDRLQHLKKSGILKPEQVDNFRREGVIGSHLENIQRDQGFKGFNQESVSDIIRRTDPRFASRNA